jgi:hypothetical protein
MNTRLESLIWGVLPRILGLSAIGARVGIRSLVSVLRSTIDMAVLRTLGPLCSLMALLAETEERVGSGGCEENGAIAAEDIGNDSPG